MGTQSGFRFNPRVREGRDLIPAPICKRRPCFNPRVREGRDVTDYFKNCVDQVSIHASVKDATYMYQDKDKFLQFQSTRP